MRRARTRLQTTIERGATSPWRVFLSFRADCLDVRGRRRRRRRRRCERQKRRLHPQVPSLGLSRGGKCTFLHLTRYSAPARTLPSVYTRTFRDQRSANVFLPLLQVYETRLSLWTDVASTLDDFYYYYYVDDLELEILRNWRTWRGLFDLVKSIEKVSKLKISRIKLLLKIVY